MLNSAGENDLNKQFDDQLVLNVFLLQMSWAF